MLVCGGRGEGRSSDGTLNHSVACATNHACSTTRHHGRCSTARLTSCMCAGGVGVMWSHAQPSSLSLALFAVHPSRATVRSNRGPRTIPHFPADLRLLYHNTPPKMLHCVIPLSRAAPCASFAGHGSLKPWPANHSSPPRGSAAALPQDTTGNAPLCD